MSIYPKTFLEKYDVIEERYSTKNNPNAKKERDTRARELRKEGYQVQVETFHFDTADVFTLSAARERKGDDQEGVQ